MEYCIQLMTKDGVVSEYTVKDVDFAKRRNKIVTLRKSGELPENILGFRVFKKTFEEEVKFGNS